LLPGLLFRGPHPDTAACSGMLLFHAPRILLSLPAPNPQEALWPSLWTCSQFFSHSLSSGYIERRPAEASPSKPAPNVHHHLRPIDWIELSIRILEAVCLVVMPYSRVSTARAPTELLGSSSYAGPGMAIGLDEEIARLEDEGETVSDPCLVIGDTKLLYTVLRYVIRWKPWNRSSLSSGESNMEPRKCST